jgi:hypothetical protein
VRRYITWVVTAESILIRNRSKISMLESNVIFLEHLIVGYCLLAGLGLTVAFVALFVQRR